MSSRWDRASRRSGRRRRTGRSGEITAAQLRLDDRRGWPHSRIPRSVPDAWRHGPSGPRRAASTIFSWEGRCGRRRLDGQQIRSVTGATPTQYDVGELAKLGRPLTAPGWTTGLRGALDHSLRPQGRLHLGRPGRGHPAEKGGPPPQKDMWVAACCIRQRLPLVTLDRKDFVDFRQATQTSSKPPG